MEDWVKIRSARLKKALETTRKHLAFERILDKEIAKLKKKGLDYFEARMKAKSTPKYKARRDALLA
jgi:hypothetical protein